MARLFSNSEYLDIVLTYVEASAREGSSSLENFRAFLWGYMKDLVVYSIGIDTIEVLSERV
jgi:hypothetical protein